MTDLQAEVCRKHRDEMCPVCDEDNDDLWVHPRDLPEGTATYAADGCFDGHQPRACGEHRTVGKHRAWCFTCREWCYPDDGCIRCRYPAG